MTKPRIPVREIRNIIKKNRELKALREGLKSVYGVSDSYINGLLKQESTNQ